MNLTDDKLIRKEIEYCLNMEYDEYSALTHLREWNKEKTFTDTEIIEIITDTYPRLVAFNPTRLEDKPFLDIEYEGEGEEKKIKNIRIITGKLGRFVSKVFNIKTFIDTDEIYLYKKGVYTPGKALISAEIQRLLGDGLIKNFHIQESIGYIRRSTYTPRAYFENSPHKINLLNGIYDVKKKIYNSHTPQLLTLTQMPIKYNPDADCPKIKKFLSEVLIEEDIKPLQEMIGYCLLKDCRYQKGIIFLGTGNNGKSVLLNLITEFLGKENCSSVPLHRFDTDKFAVAQLYGKLANVCADLPHKKIMFTGNFKAAVAGDWLQGEHKHQAPFKFKNYSKMFFSANKLPSSDDTSLAYYKRWIIISFPNTFEGDTDNTKLIKELTTPKELSGLLNWAIDGLTRLLKNNQFSGYKKMEELKLEYTLKADTEKYFLEHFAQRAGEEGEFDSTQYIEKSQLYEMYVNFCKQHNTPQTKSVFNRDSVPTYAPYTRTGRKGPRGEQQLVWLNMILKVDSSSVLGVDPSVLGVQDGIGGQNKTPNTQKITLEECTDVNSGIRGIDNIATRTEKDKNTLNMAIECTDIDNVESIKDKYTVAMSKRPPIPYKNYIVSCVKEGVDNKELLIIEVQKHFKSDRAHAEQAVEYFVDKGVLHFKPDGKLGIS